MKTTTVVVIALLVAAFTTAMGGEVYKVGGSAGWTNIGHVDYKTWASTKLFRVGDTIVFEYNKEFQNVARVSYTDFLTCDGAAPYSTSTTGNYSFPIKYPGHYYFICSIPGHCQSGQKVDIRVPVAGRHSTPPPILAPIQPLPFPYPPPSAPSTPPVKPRPPHSPSPAASHSPSPSASHSQSPATSYSKSPAEAHPQSPAAAHPQSPAAAHSPSPAAAHSQSPAAAHSQSPAAAHSQSPAASQSPSPAPFQSPLPAPGLPEDTPSSTPDIPSPAIAPAPHKNTATQLVGNVKLWSTLMAVFYYLI